VGDPARDRCRPLAAEAREASLETMGVIYEAQYALFQHSAQARTDALQASFPPGAEDGKRTRARLLSCACRPASAWLDTLPLSTALELKSGEFLPASDSALASPCFPPMLSTYNAAVEPPFASRRLTAACSALGMAHDAAKPYQ
jgi:hypothetical protein